MPWRGATDELADTGLDFPTLGIIAWEWIEEHCVIPDGDQMGEPFRLTDEMLHFLVHYYRLDPTAQSMKWSGHGSITPVVGQLVRPQKWGKGPFSAAIILFEACGPALPTGGTPTATRRSTVADTAHPDHGHLRGPDANVYRALLPMIRFGPLDASCPTRA
jgi:hypothetical protein